MTRVSIHIGLHKTGTTSFQNACVRHSNVLREHGIIYPNSVELTCGTAQHQGLVATLRSASPDEVKSTVEGLYNASFGARQLLLSSEEFSTLFGLPDTEQAPRVFHSALKDAFSNVEYICVIRNDREILRSSLREKIEGGGLPFNGAAFVRREVDGLYERTQRLNRILRGHLTTLRYETLSSGKLINDLLTAATGIAFDLPEVHNHATSAKDARYLFMSAARSLLFNALGARTPYTAEVNAAYSKIFQGMTISADVGGYVSELFYQWLDRELDANLLRQPATLESIFGFT